MSAATMQVVASQPSNRNGYRSFRLGKFELARDEYFVTVHWPAKGARRSHQMPADAFLRACMRDVAWNFFYGWVNFDHVIGTRNLYGQVDMYAGSFNGVMKEAGVDYTERFEAAHIMATFKAILRDWVNEGFDPFAAPLEQIPRADRIPVTDVFNRELDHVEPPGANTRRQLRQPLIRKRRRPDPRIRAQLVAHAVTAFRPISRDTPASSDTRTAGRTAVASSDRRTCRGSPT